MANVQIKRRRGTSAAHASFTGAEGEITYNTTTKQLHTHDGATAGGFPSNTFANVRAFGAKGDGVTNDAVAIQAAVAASKRVFFPAGTYLVNSGITLDNDHVIFGEGASSVVKAGANSLSIFNATSKNNISISFIAIDGGGQTSGIGAGVRAAIGIDLDGCQNFAIENVKIYKCGVANVGAESTDNGYGGFGILVDSRAGLAAYGIIKRCDISLIAGGGNNAGDGIYIAGYNASSTIKTQGVTVINCNVSTCGRHCYTVAGGSGQSVPEGVEFISCYAEKAALCGIDLEDGDSVSIIGCKFKSCGNDLTYLNPATVYGATYRLLAGVAATNNNIVNTIKDCLFTGCYYGITYGATESLHIDGVVIRSSVVSDLAMLLANGPIKCRITNSAFNTANAFTINYTTTRNDFVCDGCHFAGQVRVTGSAGMVFNKSTFAAGFAVYGTGVNNITFTDCLFTDFAGSAITANTTARLSENFVFKGCRFIGTGNLVNGLNIDYRNAVRWTVENCLFSGLTGSGVHVVNGSDGGELLASCSGNNFVSCAYGIRIVNGGIKNAKIIGNNFQAVSQWCISCDAVGAGGVFTGNNITDNGAQTSCVNGLRILVGTGAWNYCNVLGNNWNACSGTKQNLDAGNANGFTANNVTT